MDVSSTTIALSRIEGKQLILNACNIVWQIYWDSCHTGRHYHKVQRSNKEKKIIHNISRREQVILTHIRHYKQTLYIIGKHNTGLCNICLTEESVEHFLIICSEYERERN